MRIVYRWNWGGSACVSVESADGWEEEEGEEGEDGGARGR